MKKSKGRGILALWLVVYAILALGLVKVVPPGQAPDEMAHWQYVESVAMSGRLPVFHGQIPPAPGYEFHQPPLYYVLCAPLWAATPPGVQNYACRLVCLLCGLLTIVAVWKTALLLWPDDLRLATIAGGLAALWPLHIGVGAAANNDALAGLICACLFGRIAHLGVGRPVDELSPTLRDALGIGIGAGLGLLCKNTVIPVALVSLFALWSFARRAKKEQRETDSIAAMRSKSPRASGTAAAAIGMALLLWAPLAIRNTLLYGDPLAYRVFAGAANVSPGLLQFIEGGWGAGYVRWFLLSTFSTAWGFFGGPETARQAWKPFPPGGLHWPEAPLLALMLMCLLASIIGAWGALKYFGAWRERMRSGEGTLRDAVAGWWALGVLLIGAAWLNFGVAHMAGAQARYGHPAFLPRCIGLSWGWIKIWGRNRTLTIISLLFAFVLLAINAYNLLVWKTLV